VPDPLAGASADARRRLDALHRHALNVELEHLDSFTRANGWNLDAYCQRLPSEPPGEPAPGGAFAVARELMEAYEFADPSMIRAIWYPDRPLEGRDMLLEARFLGLRFFIGVRVVGVIDSHRQVEERPVQVWGWAYATLQGHFEMGRMDYEVWKWLDDGAVEFRINVVSRRARVGNPFVRIGFRLVGRRLQRRFARRACVRMADLVPRLQAERAPGEVATGRAPESATSVPVRPFSGPARTDA
jgi:uncharacterized protein (UPF0548 family)